MKLNEREVVDVQVDGVDSKDHPDYCDAYFSRAIFSDTGEELNDDELLKLTEENPETLNEMAFMSLV